MDEKVRAFLETNRNAAMITLRRDGTPHAVRVGIALVDGMLWSSGTQARVRTRHLRRDPRATLYVPEANGYGFLSIESTVRILEGADAPEQNLKLFRVMQSISGEDDPVAWFGQSQSPQRFLEIMAEEQRLIYQFEITRTYGMFG